MAFLSGVAAVTFTLIGASLSISAVWVEMGWEWLRFCAFSMRPLFFGHWQDICPWALQKKHLPSTWSFFCLASLNLPFPSSAQSTSIRMTSSCWAQFPGPLMAYHHHGLRNPLFLPRPCVPITAWLSIQFICWVCTMLAQSSNVTDLGMVLLIIA